MPTYNERENLDLIISAIFKTVPNTDILIVDDGSPDGTGDIADSLAAENSNIAVMHRKEKSGLGSAYLAGFKYALERDYEAIFEMDADFSHNPKYLPEMLKALETADMVVGSRYVAGGGTENWGVLRKTISRGGGLYARTVLGVEVKDLTAGFVCYRRETLERIQLEEVSATGYGFQIELKYRVHCAGMKIYELPIIFPDRIRGESKMSGGIFLEALKLVWQLRLSIPRE
jgi:dolichol-phosphate mannosyltransferase